MPEPPGEDCQAGGTRVLAGLDLDEDGLLDPSEVSSVSFVCASPSNRPEPAIWAPFDVPGCFPNGARLATDGSSLLAARSSPATYTDGAGLVQTCPPGTARIGPDGLVVEGNHLNTVESPSALDQAPWASPGGRVVVVPDATTSPGGHLTADRLERSSTLAGASLSQAIPVPAGYQVLTAYLKAGSTSSVDLGLSRGGLVNGTAKVLSGPGAVAGTGPFTVFGLSRTEWTRVQVVTAASLAAGVVTLDLFPNGQQAAAAGLGLYVAEVSMERVGVPSNFIAGAASADLVSLPNPLSWLPPTGGWCAGGRFTPLNGREWWSDLYDLFSIGFDGADVSATLQNWSDASFHLVVHSGGGGYRELISARNVFHPGSTHEVYGCSDGAGGLSIWVDGALVGSGPGSGPGTGVLPSQPGSIYLGGTGSGGRPFVGSIKHFKVWPLGAPISELQRQNLLWFSDSIYNNGAMWDQFGAQLHEQPFSNVAATYGGNPIGGGLLELADATSWWDGYGWASASRGLPWSAIAGGLFEFMRNDANNGEPLDTYAEAYDKLIAQSLARLPVVVAGNCPPRASGDLASWDLANDAAVAGGYTEAAQALASKWGIRFLDTHSLFLEMTASEGYTVSQLMRDAWHPTTTYGMAAMARRQAALWRSSASANQVSPTIPGLVTNHLFGRTVAGSWTLSTGLVSTTGPTQGPLWRIAGLPDQANVAIAAGARLAFPTFQSADRGQVWVHFLVDQASGGTADVYLDRGAATQARLRVNTQVAGVQLYPRAMLLVGGLAAGPHEVEIETTGPGPVRVLGVTYVGVQP